MNLQFFLEKLHNSEEFKKFKKQNPDAFPCSAFFIIDKQETDKKSKTSSSSVSTQLAERKPLATSSTSSQSKGKDNKYHFDYYVPSNKKILSFQLEGGIKLVPMEMFGEKIPKRVLLNYTFDFKDIEKMINDEMERQRIKNKIQKILLSLQNLNGKDFLVGTVFISQLGLLKINIDISEKKITHFEKKSFFNMLKIIKKKK